MATAWEVIDTAVKVGLGALISGLTTYWVTKAKTKDELRKERLQRHQALLEQAAGQIEDSSHTFLRYWALVTEWVRNSKKGVELLPQRREELERTKQTYFDCFKEMASAESKLLLLGHTEAHGLLREYGELAVDFRRKAVDGNNDLTEEVMEQFRRQLLHARARLFGALSAIYRKET